MHEYWEDIHNKLQHLHGRVKLSDNPLECEPWQDVIGFVLSRTAAGFFDILELTFRTSPVWRVLHDENELVDGMNELFRVENAPYQLTRIVKVEEPNPIKAGPFGGGGTIIRTVAYPPGGSRPDETSNHRNCTTEKRVLTDDGPIALEVSRDSRCSCSESSGRRETPVVSVAFRAHAARC